MIIEYGGGFVNEEEEGTILEFLSRNLGRPPPETAIDPPNIVRIDLSSAALGEFLVISETLALHGLMISLYSPIAVFGGARVCDKFMGKYFSGSVIPRLDRGIHPSTGSG